MTKKTKRFLFSVISVHLAVIARYLGVTTPKMGDFLTVACHGGKSHKLQLSLVLFLFSHMFYPVFLRGLLTTKNEFNSNNLEDLFSLV